MSYQIQKRKWNKGLLKSIFRKLISLFLLTILMVIPITIVMYSLKQKHSQNTSQISNKWDKKEAHKPKIIDI